MSLLDSYRLFTGKYIYESDLPAESKLEFIRFIKEASAGDVMDILSGQYEGVKGLTLDEIKLVHSTLKEISLSGVRSGIRATGRSFARRGKDALGYAKVGRAKAAQAASIRAGKGVPTKSAQHRIDRVGGMKRRAVRGAMTRTGIAAGVAGGVGYGGYRAVKR